jgi:Mitochondrial carrier protein.
MSSPMAGVALVNAIVFGVYGNFQRNLPRHDALSSHFMAGAAAGFAQSFVCCPLELVKSRLQVQQNGVVSGRGYSGAMDCFAQVASLQ